jgi:hypothetical protein
VNGSLFKSFSDGTGLMFISWIEPELCSSRVQNEGILKENTTFLKCMISEVENRLLRIIFGPKRDGVTGGWRKLHNKELHNLYSLPSIIRIIKPRRM